MTDEQKENKRAQNAEVLMWLAFICCGMMIAFGEKHHTIMLLSEQEAHSKILPLLERIAEVLALLLCFPPFYRRKLQNSMTPSKDVVVHTLCAFLVAGAAKGVLII